MDYMSIDAAVEAFMNYVDDNSRPLRQLADYLIVLQVQGWSQADIREVQIKAMAALAKRLRPKVSSDDRDIQ